jgi:hypothetical protein
MMRPAFIPRSRRLVVLLVCAGLVAGVAWYGVTHHHVLQDTGELCLALAATTAVVVPRRRRRMRLISRGLCLDFRFPRTVEPARAPVLWHARAGPPLLQVFRR